MTEERRRFPRIRYPLDGQWHAVSGGVRCRISDIGRGGCLVNALSAPEAGEMTSITIRLPGGAELMLHGTVTTPERGVGFGFVFDPLSPRES